MCRHPCMFLDNKILDFILRFAFPTDINFVWLNIFDMYYKVLSPYRQKGYHYQIKWEIIEQMMKGQKMFLN